MHAHNRTIRQSTRASGLLAALSVAFAASSADAQGYLRDVPPDTDGIGINERLDETISLHLPFVNHRGERVTLADYFEPGKPIILTLNYYTCPQLCHLTLNGLVQGLNDVEWTIGEEFRVVTVSIHPHEEPEDAASFHRAYGGRYEREIVGDGWAFLIGEERYVKQLADEVGFLYRFVPETGEYAHASSIIFITPDGRIARYINHFVFEPRDLRMALIESSEGKIGTRSERFMMFLCYEYDPDAGSYVLAAWKVMRAAGLMTVIFLVVGLIVLWWKGGRHEQRTRSGRESKLTLSGVNP
jgi:protein SCO1